MARRLLSTAELGPRGLPPSAVLLVRELRDPLPGAFGGAPAANTADERWQVAVRQRLDSIARSAARSERGRVPAAADALLFRDEAELYACWWAALGRGTPHAWWCHAASFGFGPQHPAQAPSELLPAVISALVSWGETHAVVRSLTPSAARELATRVARSHGLTWSLSVPPPALVAGAATPDSWSGHAAHDTNLGPEPGESEPPWRAVLDQESSRYGAEHELLLGTCLMLRHRPRDCRCPTFARRIASWFAARVQEASRLSPQPTASIDQRARLEPEARSAAEPADDPMPRPPAVETSISPSGVHRLRREAPPETSRAHPAPSRALPSRAGVSALENRRTAPAREPGGIEPLAAVPPTPALELVDSGIVTELGGVLFLINLMEHLGLPEAFEASCGLASAVGYWGTLEAIARGLFTPLPRDLERDPIWSALATLDARSPGQPPRAEGLRPAALQVPEQWPALPEARGASPPPQLVGWPEPLLDWLNRMTPYLRARLARALGASLEELDLVRDLGRCSARLFVTGTHVDLIVGLDDIRVPVRLAGLDRSPAWVPMLGRVVLFHFE